MSTRSCIILKVRKEDIGKTFKFDASKVRGTLCEWVSYGDQVDKEKSEEVTINSPYIGIYCHNNGYLDGVGRVLKEQWNNYEELLNLIVGGFCSVIWDDEIRHYANRNGEKWEYIEPHQGKSVKAIQDTIDHQYCYVFDEDNGWRWRGFSGGKFKEL